MTNQEISFKDYERLIDKLSWKSYRMLQRQGVAADINDLRQEGASAFIRARDKFDPSFNIKFSTYLWTAVQNAHKRFAGIAFDNNHKSLNEQVGDEGGVDLIDLIEDDRIECMDVVIERNQEREASFRRYMSALHPDTRKVIEVLILRPDSLLKELERCRAHSKHSKALGFASPNYSFNVDFICNVLGFDDKRRKNVAKEVKWVISQS